MYFSDQLNLRKLTVQYSTYDFYTEIEPYGKDGLTIETVNSGKTYLENHQYSSKKKRCIWKDERYTIADSLKEDAAAKLADMSKPYVSYSADIVDLSRNSQKYSIRYKGDDSIMNVANIPNNTVYFRIIMMDEIHPVLLSSGGILVGYLLQPDYYRQMFYSSQVIASRTCYGGKWSDWQLITKL